MLPIYKYKVSINCLNFKHCLKFLILKYIYYITLFVLNYFNTYNLYGLSEIKSPNNNTFMHYSRSQDFDSSILILKGHLKFHYNTTILEADYGNNKNTGLMLENGSSSQNSRNYNSFKLVSQCWGGVHRATMEKTTNVGKSRINSKPSQLNEDKNSLYYANLNLKHHLNAPLGQIFTFFASARGELYQADRFKQTFSQEIREEVGVYPKIGMEWNGPSVSIWQEVLSLQPVGKLTAEPNRAIGNGPLYIFENSMGGANAPGNISGKDVKGAGDPQCAIGAGHLSGSNRFFANNGMEEGNRAIYGNKFLAKLGSFGNVNFFLGQQYAFSKSIFDNKFQSVRPRLSDYIGRLEANLTRWLLINGRIQFDRKSLKSSVSEIGCSLIARTVIFSGTYSFINNFTGIGNQKDFKKANKQINFFFISPLTENWFLMGSLMQCLKGRKRGGDTFMYGTGVNYNNKYFNLSFTVNYQSFPYMQKSKTSTLFMLTFGFNNEIGYPSSSINESRKSRPSHSFP